MTLGSCGSGITGGANSLPLNDPNPAHDAVAQMERQFERFWLITQNVDGLHRDAGSRKLSEIHGNIWMVRCTHCGSVNENRDVPIAILPLCGTCGGLLRPHIVWFGESLAEEDLRKSDTALQSSDLCLIIGTSGLVYPAAGFASIAKQAGAFVAEINLDPTPHTGLVDAVASRPRKRSCPPPTGDVREAAGAR